MTKKSIYKATNSNSDIFDHFTSKRAAIEWARHVEHNTRLSESELTRAKGWSFLRGSDEEAEDLGF
ncbi:MAG: hypothetical protein J0H25_02300 [Rhizobiales bacterium]|nr:hypothetical protein [Hyphomicrobiales bacterium]